MKTILTTLICLISLFSFSNSIGLDNCTGDSTDVLCQDNQDSVNVFLLMGRTRESGHWNPVFVTELKKSIPNGRIFFLDLPGSGKYVNVKACLSIKGMIDFMRPDV